MERAREARHNKWTQQVDGVRMQPNASVTIMVVDDDSNVRTTVSDLLRAVGFTVHSVGTAEAAVDRLEEVSPDVVILDISMPGMGGIGFLRHITQQDGSLSHPVLILTARPGMDRYFSHLPVSGFLTKPCNGDILLEKVEQIVEETRRPNGPPRQPGRTVMIAENDPDTLANIVAAFSQAGFHVKTARSGPEALDTAATTHPDIILLKNLLPGMNGKLLAPLLVAMPSINNVPILLYDHTYAHDVFPWSSHTPSDGVKRFLPTCDAAVLLKEVQELVAERSSTHED